MRKNYLIQPKVQVKTFKVNDFLNITEHAESVVVGEKLSAIDICSNYSQTVGFEILKMCEANKKIYATCNDGYLYEKVNKNFVQKNYYGTSLPIMCEVIVEGKAEVLHINQTGGRILGKNDYSVSLPYGNVLQTFALRCFVAKGKTVYFSSPFDFEKHSMKFDNCGNFSVDDSDGEILGIYDFSSYLLIVCAQQFYKLTITDGEFKLEKIKTDNFVVEKGTLAKIREQLFFVANGKFYVYEDFSIKEISNIYSKKIANLEGFATADGDVYYCPVVANGSNCVFRYDVINKTFMLVNVGERKLMCKNILFTPADNSIYTVKSTPLACSVWKSTAINLGSYDKKSLIALTIKVTKSLTFKIKGDFGSKTYKLKAGINQMTMNLRSKEFTFEIDYKPNVNTDVSDLQLKYIA